MSSTELRTRVRAPSQLLIPPASASLARLAGPDAAPTWLWLTVESTSVSVPQLSIPPPAASANGHEPPGHVARPDGTVCVGATRLPVITLLVMVTSAPPLKSALGGISTPPPRAKTPSTPRNGIDSGLDWAKPPVMVTPVITTVGSTSAPYSPIVITEPPPLMMVAFAPLPSRRTLFVIVMPPAKVPRPRRIVSPSWAATRAAWIVG